MAYKNFSWSRVNNDKRRMTDKKCNSSTRISILVKKNCLSKLHGWGSSVINLLSGNYMALATPQFEKPIRAAFLMAAKGKSYTKY